MSSQNCNCHSNNRGDGGTPNVIINPWDHLPLPRFMTWEGYRAVCVDACIAEQIKVLWKHGIWTIGSCCGHGEKQPEVILDSRSIAEATRAQRILWENDPDREWRVLQWQLVAVDDSGSIRREPLPGETP